MASLSLRHVGKTYPGGVEAVADFCLEIEDKEFIILVGPSGCGKSTTLRMIAGLEEITAGEIYIGDTLINTVEPKDRDIAMVFQNYALYPHMTVFDNMAFSLKLRKTPRDEIKKRVEEAAAILDIAHLLERKPKALSGGQRQRVALGRAIVREPKVFLLDEPLSNLDAKLRTQMRTELAKTHIRLGTTFVYVTHDQTEAMTMADRIVVMKDGYIQQVDTPANLYEKPSNTFVAGFLGSPQMNFIDGVVEVDGERVLVHFGTGGVRYSALLSGEKAACAKPFHGSEIILGIRPEHLHDEPSYLSGEGACVVDATVEVSEMMGAESYLYLSAAGCSMVARVAPRTDIKNGETIKIALDVNRLHLFEKETEKAICN